MDIACIDVWTVCWKFVIIVYKGYYKDLYKSIQFLKIFKFLFLSL